MQNVTVNTKIGRILLNYKSNSRTHTCVFFLKNIILKYYYLHHTYNYFHSIILNDYCIHIFYYAYYIYKSPVQYFMHDL